MEYIQQLSALNGQYERYFPIPFSLKEKNYTMNLKCVTEDPLTERRDGNHSFPDKNNRLIKGHVFLWKGAKDWHEIWDEDGVIVK